VSSNSAHNGNLADSGVTIYHNPRCGKSRQTLELLRQRGIEPRIVEYLKTPPSVAELRKLLKMLGMAPSQLLRSKEAAEAGIDAKALSDDKLVEAMVRLGTSKCAELLKLNHTRSYG
jgi:arsenate reductase